MSDKPREWTIKNGQIVSRKFVDVLDVEYTAIEKSALDSANKRIEELEADVEGRRAIMEKVLTEQTKEIIKDLKSEVEYWKQRHEGTMADRRLVDDSNDKMNEKIQALEAEIQRLKDNAVNHEHVISERYDEKIQALEAKLNQESYCHDKCVQQRTQAEIERDALKSEVERLKESKAGLIFDFNESKSQNQKMKSAIQRRLKSDESCELPFDEDLAEALKALTDCGDGGAK